MYMDTTVFAAIHLEKNFFQVLVLFRRILSGEQGTSREAENKNS